MRSLSIPELRQLETQALDILRREKDRDNADSYDESERRAGVIANEGIILARKVVELFAECIWPDGMSVDKETFELLKTFELLRETDVCLP